MRFIRVFLRLLIIMPTFVYGGGKVYWQENGVPVIEETGRDFITSVRDGYGGAIILWADSRAGVTDFSLYAQRVDSMGEKLWDSLGVLVAYDIGWYPEPVGVNDGEGGMIVAWVNEDWYSPTDIYAARVDSGGNVRWIIPVCEAEGQQLSPSIVSDGKGGAIIAWMDERLGWGVPDIYIQRIDGDGNILWDYNGIRVSETHKAGLPFLCFSTYERSIIVVWMESEDRWNYRIMAQKLDLYGNKLWGDSGVVVRDYGDCRLKDVAGVDRRYIGVVWVDRRSGEWESYMQILDLDGNTLFDSSGVVIFGNVAWIRPQRVVKTGLADFIVLGTLSLAENYEIWLNRVDTLGNKLWGDGVYIVSPADTSVELWDYVDLISDGSGGVILSWNDLRSGNWDIYAQHVDSLGNILWDSGGMPVCVMSPSGQSKPKIVKSISGSAIIGWCDGRYGGSVSAQRVGDSPDLMEVGNVRQVNRVFRVYPNPFRREIEVSFYNLGWGELKIYNAVGEVIRCWDMTGNGRQILRWRGEDNRGRCISPGVYFIVLEKDKQKNTQKIIFLGK
jgi:hypothetical protein